MAAISLLVIEVDPFGRPAVELPNGNAVASQAAQNLCLRPARSQLKISDKWWCPA
jgi:hypothetical protein